MTLFAVARLVRVADEEPLSFFSATKFPLSFETVKRAARGRRGGGEKLKCVGEEKLPGDTP